MTSQTLPPDNACYIRLQKPHCPFLPNIEKKCYFLFLFLVFVHISQGQTNGNSKSKYLKFSVSNSHTARPFGSFTSLLYRDFHPGAEIGFESTSKNKNRRVWFYEARLGYMFHQWVQHNVALFANVGYRHELLPSWFGEVKLGGGYQHSISNSKVYEISADGLRKKRNLGRSQAIANFSIALSKKLLPASDNYLFLEYRQQVQTPFIKEYVPVLPYNTMLVGVKFPFAPSSSKPKK